MQFERAMEKMRKHILDLESQRIHQERTSITLRMEKEASSRELDELRAELERHKKGTDAETELSKVQQNYQIMKEAYAKMRGEHLELIRSVSLSGRPFLLPHHFFFRVLLDFLIVLAGRTILSYVSKAMLHPKRF